MSATRSAIGPLAAFAIAAAGVVFAADTGFRIRMPGGNWIDIEEINRTDPESLCRLFNAVQVTVHLNESTAGLEQSLTKKEPIDPVEIDFTRKDRPYVRLELKKATVTNVRTLGGSKQRVTLRYESCSVKEKKASGGA